MERKYDLNNWECNKFADATSLENYLAEIKPMFIGKIISKIMIMGVVFRVAYWDEKEHRFLQTDYDDNINPDRDEALCMNIDEPIVLFIGTNRLEIQPMNCASRTCISINKLNLNENSYQNNSPDSTANIWRDITFAYKKNIIGQEVTDIYINKTRTLRTWDVVDYTNGCADGDDMFYELCIKFKNGYEIAFSTDMDEGQVTERQYCKYRDAKQKQYEKGIEDWVNAEETEYPSLIYRINNEVVPQSRKLKIIPNIYGDYFGLFFKIESDYGISYLELPFFEQEVNDLLLWLENIVDGKYWRNCLALQGDGYWVNYLAVEIDNENRDYIKYVHITDSIYGGVYVEEFKTYCSRQVYPATVPSGEFEPLVKRNAFIIDKRTFIKEFYNAYKQIIDIDASKLKDNLYKDEISDIRKSSSVIENYLNFIKRVGDRKNDTNT